MYGNTVAKVYPEEQRSYNEDGSPVGCVGDEPGVIDHVVLRQHTLESETENARDSRNVWELGGNMYSYEIDLEKPVPAGYKMLRRDSWKSSNAVDFDRIWVDAKNKVQWSPPVVTGKR